jgi:hypothetical protein
MPNLIINKVDIAEYKQVSRALSVEKSDEYIREAQEIDLRAILPAKFYADLVVNFQQAKYQTLIHGTTYVVDGITYEFAGLKAFMAYMAYARLVLTVDVVNTPFGLNRKLSQDSEPISHVQKRDIRDESRQTAMVYWDQVKAYIEANKETYPLYFEGCATSRTFLNRIRIDKI